MREEFRPRENNEGKITTNNTKIGETTQIDCEKIEFD
jgi:hypothetical protein